MLYSRKRQSDEQVYVGAKVQKKNKCHKKLSSGMLVLGLGLDLEAEVLGLGLGFGLVLGLEISRPRTISRTSKM